MDFITLDTRLITENNLHDDNRPYRYEQNKKDNKIYLPSMKTAIIMTNT